MQVYFSEEGHVYRHGDPVSGPVLTSITQIIGAHSEWFTPEAALRGTHKHRAIELYCHDDLDEETLDDEYRAAVEGFKRFVGETGFTVLETEVIVHSDIHLFAGRVDIIGMFPGDTVKSICELKTGQYPEYCCLQTAAQALCLEGFHKRFGLHIHEDKYKLHPHTNRTDTQEFLTLLASKRTREKYGL